VIAVTGATGFVGSALVDALLRNGIPVRLLPRGVLSAVPPNATQFPIGDLGSGRIDPDAMGGCRVLVHTAARAHQMGDHPQDLGPYERTNVAGSVALAKAAITAGVEKFIFISSIKACGEWSFPGQPLTPRDPCQPLDAYGRSKLAAEQELTRLAGDSGMDLVIIRPPLIHGPGAKGNLQRLMAAIAQGKPLPLGGISTNRRSVLGLTNLCDAISCVAGSQPHTGTESPVKHPEAAEDSSRSISVYHLNDGKAISTRRLVELLAEGMGKRPRLFTVPRWMAMTAATLLGKRDYVRRLYGDMETSGQDFCDDYRWQPKVSVEDGLRSMASHFIGTMR
jgi:nucleoside-diphosphate-sugar epimerase